ncbi:hypothetical protein ACOBQX_02745 [Actinokineospora sp. G85]|uniref:hypothetical protein n=1 Tax=Actinokineospora sp. G85 TaxID=3406626 RepID=UPI003C794147
MTRSGSEPGSHRPRAATWRGDRVTDLLVPDALGNDAVAINERGDVILLSTVTDRVHLAR